MMGKQSSLNCQIRLRYQQRNTFHPLIIRLSSQLEYHEKMTSETRQPEVASKRRSLKEFRHQESLLHQMLDDSAEFRSFHAFLMAFAHVVVVVQILIYYFDRELLREDATFMHWAFVESFTKFLFLWSQLLILTSLAYPLSWLLISGRISYRMFQVSIPILMVTTTNVCVNSSGLSNVLYGALAAEHVRLTMKMVAYAVATSRKAGDKQILPSFQHFFYFLFAPTLLYRDSYPRTEKTNWKRVFILAYYFMLMVLFHLMAIRHWITPLYRDFGLKPMSYQKWLSNQVTIFLLAFLFHYGGLGIAIIHSWMNIFAEVMRFADRNFYQDVWNATNVMDQMRKWNSVVGDWIFEYVYPVIVRMTSGNKILSPVCVFMISAIVHDYVLNMMLNLRMVPLFFLTYGVLGFVALSGLIAYHKYGLSRWVGSQVTGSLLMHFALAFSYFLWINFYAFEFYSRKNVPESDQSLLDAFTPKMFRHLRWK